MGSGASTETLKQKEEELEALRNELEKNKKIIEEIIENKKKEDERKRIEEEKKKQSQTQKVEELGLSKKLSTQRMTTTYNLRKQSFLGAPLVAKPETKEIIRRGEISAEIMQKVISERGTYEKKVYPKSDSERALLQNIVNDNMLFIEMEEEAREDCINAFQNVTVTAGTSIIKQWSQGDFFYVLQKGKCDIYVAANEKTNKVKVGILDEGQCFGELALLYNSPRAATIVSITECVLWGFSRAVYREILLHHKSKKFEKIEHFLQAVTLLKPLTPMQRGELAAIMIESQVEEGAIIIRQKEKGNLFYIIEDGEVEYFKTNEDGQIEILGKGKSGDYFGERALIEEDTRACSVRALSSTKLLSVALEEFNSFIGDLKTLVHPEASHKSISEDATIKHKHNIALEELQILNTLGCGAFGRVKLVKKKGSSDCFALKCLIKQHIVDNALQDHVANEKQIMMLLDHPFILRLHNTYNDKKMVYFLIELCQGGEMFTHLRRVEKYSEKDARFWAASIVLCLGELRKKNIAYRDLKPENIMFDAKGYLKMVDFGLAKIVNDRTWTLCGTPDYLAPEIILSKGHNCAADYWALGVLIFEMMTGYAPFYSNDIMKVYARIIQNDLHFPFDFNKTAEDIIRKFLKPNQAKRLGMSNSGMDNIKKDRWFSGFDWDALIEKRLESPIKPVVLSADDVSNFDAYPEDDSHIPDCDWDPKDF